MSKAILMSFQPTPCSLIASCVKKNEVRKRRPKIQTPFKVYMYATKSGDRLVIKDTGVFEISKNLTGKVIGEFICDEITEHNWLSYRGDYGVDKDFLSKACLSYKDLREYGNEKILYCWHISDLVIYDKPKELSEFYKHDSSYDNSFGWAFEDRDKRVPITRPPQSWCYVEEVTE